MRLSTVADAAAASKRTPTSVSSDRSTPAPPCTEPHAGCVKAQHSLALDSAQPLLKQHRGMHAQQRESAWRSLSQLLEPR